MKRRRFGALTAVVFTCELLVSLTSLPGVAVAASGVNITGTEAVPFSGRVANIDSCSFTSATIDWGDGNSSAGQFDTGTTPGVKGTHIYAEEGTYQGSVTYSTDCTNNGVVTFTATIGDEPLNATGVDISPTTGQPFTGVVAHFSDADPNGTASDYTAQVNWGDGSSSVGTVSASSAGGFDVIGTHTYNGAGQAAVNVAIFDAGGSAASSSSTATITNPPPPLKASFTWSPANPCQTGTNYWPTWWAAPLIDASASQGAITSVRWTITDFSSQGSTTVLEQNPIVIWIGIGFVSDPIFPTLSSPPSWPSPSDFDFDTAPLGTVVHYLRPPTTLTLTVFDSQGGSDSVQHTITYADPDEAYKVVNNTYSSGGYSYSVKTLEPVLKNGCELSRLAQHFGELTLSVGAATLNGERSLTTSVSCPGTGNCLGTLYVLRPGQIRHSALRAVLTRKRPAAPYLGRTSFLIHGGKRHQTLKIPLNKAGRRLARASRLKRVTLLALIAGRKPRIVTVRVRPAG